MTESVFKEMLRNRVVSDVSVQEIIPSKGKPAKKADGSKTVWIVNVSLNDRRSLFLESARGGAREWASLDNLDKWLKSCGVERYSITHREGLLQQSLSFINNGR